LGALLFAHLVTRVVLAALVIDGRYPFRAAGTILGDVNLYRRYAAELLAGGAPYTQVTIEYPPGVLPAIVLPGLAGTDALVHRVAFVALCLALDAGVLAALLAIARRAGSRLAGPWAWVGGLVLLGPLALTRLDLLPALATVLAVQRGSAGRAAASGAWLGFGAAAKLYPGLLLLPAAAAAWRPGRSLRAQRPALALGGGAVVAGLLTAALAGPGLATMLRTVVGYHLERSLQVESLWATPVLVARRLGAPADVAYTFGAYHLQGPAAAVAEQLASVAAAAALAGGTWLTARAVRARAGTRPAPRPQAPAGLAPRPQAPAGLAPRSQAPAGLAEGLYVTMLLLLATGSVLSPQYLVWALALAAAALAAGTRALRRQALAVLPVAALTQAVYPVLYDQVSDGTWAGLALLAARNVSLAVVAGWAALALWRAARPVPAAHRQDREPRDEEVGHPGADAWTGG